MGTEDETKAESERGQQQRGAVKWNGNQYRQRSEAKLEWDKWQREGRVRSRVRQERGPGEKVGNSVRRAGQ